MGRATRGSERGSGAVGTSSRRGLRSWIGAPTPAPSRGGDGDVELGPTLGTRLQSLLRGNGSGNPLPHVPYFTPTLGADPRLLGRSPLAT